MNGQFWIIESSGSTRQVWGPYASLEHAQKEAGKRHVVVKGSGLENGQTMSQGALRNALQSDRIYTVDGSLADALA